MPQKEKTFIEIFTDGACSGNPGIGGYGALLRYDNKTKEISGFELQTTNNRMELKAVIEALRQIKSPSRIRVVSDSNYVVKGMKEWILSWVKNNWKNAQNKPVLNKDLWLTLIILSEPHHIDWQWVRGHQGHAENERCDQLARQAIRICQREKGPV
ncbi:MAG: ribonuclease HI [Pseudomonadota bacterium]